MAARFLHGPVHTSGNRTYLEVARGWLKAAARIFRSCTATRVFSAHIAAAFEVRDNNGVFSAYRTFGEGDDVVLTAAATLTMDVLWP